MNFHFYFVFVVKEFQICECLTYRTVASQHGLSEGSLTVEDMFCRQHMPILQEAINNIGFGRNYQAFGKITERDLRRKLAGCKIRRTRKVHSIHFPRSGNVWRGPLQGNKAVIGQGAQASGVARRSRCHNVDEPC